MKLVADGIGQLGVEDAVWELADVPREVAWAPEVSVCDVEDEWGGVGASPPDLQLIDAANVPAPLGVPELAVPDGMVQGMRIQIEQHLPGCNVEGSQQGRP